MAVNKGSSSQTTVKEEPDWKKYDQHNHTINIISDPVKEDRFEIRCRHPRTVLEAIKSHEEWEKIQYPDGHIIIQLGKDDKNKIVATHFPCSCVENEVLIIKCDKSPVEEVKDHTMEICATDEYSVFYIDTVGGKNAKCKNLFRNRSVKDYKYLCVYGRNDMSMEDALKNDGRFSDLGDFQLTNNEDIKERVARTDSVENLNGKYYKITCTRQKRQFKASIEKPQGEPSNIPPKCQLRLSPRKSTTSVRQATSIKNKPIGDGIEIEDLLREQFPELKRLMLERYSDESYQETLNMKKELFGKIQQSFSEVHRIRKLVKLAKSVCKLIVGNEEGTGFVLFGEFIMTNAHLFKNCVEGKNLQVNKEVTATFNYEKPLPNQNYYTFTAKTQLIDIDTDLDYAILELTTTQGGRQVPPQLLNKFGPVPTDGECCLIGHPAGGVKKMDPTCIIEKEDRLRAINDHLHPYKDTMFMIQSISQIIKNQGIENILTADEKVTYNTFMYHGSSGSPVFDGSGNVFGLHTAGFTYGFPVSHCKSVIEYATPLHQIFKKFVNNMKECGNENLLKSVEKAAKGNNLLEMLLKPNQEEPMETD